MSDEPLVVCPECRQPTLKRRIGTGAGIIFKGGGFYETDFKDKKGSNGTSAATSSSKDNGNGSADKKADTASSSKGVAAAAQSGSDA
jgi:predicted nucleic acid-binding Zn ribbon protein